MMARRRKLRHPQVDLFERWLEDAARLSHTESTTASYSTDVARFLRWLNPKRLEQIDESDIAAFLAMLPQGGKRRMVAGLSEFLAFADREVDLLLGSDPLRKFKYGRSPFAIGAQLSLLDLLVAQGVPAGVVRLTTWSDFIEPMTRRPQKLGKLRNPDVVLEESTQKRLEAEFRSIASSVTLGEALKRRIA